VLGDASSQRLQEVQPNLAARWERRDGVSESIHWNLANHGDCRGMQELGHIDARERGANKHLAVLVEDEASATRRVVPHEAAAGVGTYRSVDGAHPKTRGLGAGKCVPNRRDLWLGEDHAGGEMTI